MKNGDGKAAVEMVGLIRDLIIEELDKRDSTEVCKIATVNSDGTYNILIPPDDRNVIRNVKSISPDKLEQGDVAYIYKFLGKLNNAIIIAKIGANSSDLRFLTVDDIPLFEGSSSSSGGDGDVTDVLMNGVSVVDSDGVAHVTDHYPTTFTWTSGTTSGPTGSLTGNTGFTAVSFGAIPSATLAQSGVVTTGNQSFKGNKTFSDHIEVNGDDSQHQLKDYDLSIYGDRLEVYNSDDETTTTLLFPDTGDVQTIATLSDISNLNIENGSTTGSLQQVFDGSTFNFVNPNSPLGGTTVNIGIATGTYATMLGGKGRVEGKRSFVNGTQVVATGNYAHAEGNNTHASGVNSHAEGIQTYASGSAAHAEGSSTAATETGAHSEGYGTHADGVYTHAEGAINFVLGDNAHAEGGHNIIGVYSGPSPEPGPAPEPGTAVHAEGMGSHAEGNNNTITGYYSHAEGQENTVSSNRAHAEGNGNTVSGLYAHAEGNSGVASGEGAHSEGLYGHAIGNYSHAEGAATYANGLYSHAAGQDSTANGTASFASGYHVTANRDYQTVLGKYNLGQSPDTLLEVGKGTAENARSNAFEVHADGHAEVGLMGSTTNSVATKGYVDSKADNDHYPTTFTWTNGTTAGPTGSLTGNTGFTAVSFGAIPSANFNQSGVVTTGDQAFAGTKTFESIIFQNNNALVIAPPQITATGPGEITISPLNVNNSNLVLNSHGIGSLKITNDGTLSLDNLGSGGTTRQRSYLQLPQNKGTSQNPATIATLSDIPVIPIVDLTGL